VRQACDTGHDRYWRRLQDLACCGRPIQVVLQVRWFICDNPACVVAAFADLLRKMALWN
jgi:hypothetical protein